MGRPARPIRVVQVSRASLAEAFPHHEGLAYSTLNLIVVADKTRRLVAHELAHCYGANERRAQAIEARYT